MLDGLIEMKSTLITPDQSSVAERSGSKGTLRIFFKDTYSAKCGRIPCAIGYCTDEFRLYDVIANLTRTVQPLNMYGDLHRYS